jgi:cysteinyl-tRNA synthetase
MTARCNEEECRCRVSQVNAKSVADGDTVTVYVDASDPRVCGSVPREVQRAAEERARARAAKNYQKADALLKTVVDAGYR